MTKAILFSLAFASASAFAAVTPMNLVEKAAHKVTALVTKKQIDPSYATDITSGQIAVDANGTTITLKAPAADPQQSNALVLKFDATGTFVSFAADFKAKSAQSPIFSPADAATLLDLGAEGVVDHLTESPDLPVVAANAKTIDLAREGTGVHLRIGLADGRTYSVMMDLRGKVVSKGF